jgi:hypothetical protein
MTTLKLNCGCIQTQNDRNPCKNDFNITFNISDFITEYKCNNEDDKCNNLQYKQHKRQIIKDEETKNVSVSKLKIFEENILFLEYEKIPIKYLKEQMLDNKYIDCKCQCHYSRSGLVETLLKIQKINNRFYCCKNRVDKYIELELYKYYFINSFRWS